MRIFNKHILFFLHFFGYFLLINNNASSQGWCGTVTTPQQIAFELSQISQQQGLKTFTSVPCLEKKLSIIAYIVRDSLGQPNITEQDILDAIDSTNKDFAPICLSFVVCEFIYVNNYQYDIYHVMPNPQNYDDEKEMMDLYYKPQVINMYFVSDIPSDPQCGHAFMPGGPDLVVIKKSCIPGLVITHELGHFFGLYHTFELGFGGAQLVSEDSCVIKGDLVCDTEADPDPGGNVDQNCNYTGSPIKDANNEFYIPPVDNIMSYYGDCRCRFTPEQYIRMANQYLTLRSYLW